VKFVEFLEYICRIAKEKFNNLPDALYVKVEWTLDILLHSVGFDRRPIVI
jgi:hypothetical protein